MYYVQEYSYYRCRNLVIRETEQSSMEELTEIGGTLGRRGTGAQGFQPHRSPEANGDACPWRTAGHPSVRVRALEVGAVRRRHAHDKNEAERGSAWGMGTTVFLPGYCPRPTRLAVWHEVGH